MELLIGFLTAVVLALIGYGLAHLQKRSETRDEQIESSFKTLWPKLSESLKSDLEKSMASLTEARLAAESEISFPLNLAHLPNIKFYDLHLSTISRYDKTLGKAIKNYIDAAGTLNHVKHDYNQLAYSDSRDDSKFRRTKQEMYAAARKLEQLIDHSLNPQIQRYEDTLQKSS